MAKYPPVDSNFYSIGAASGMSDDEIQKDWEAFCDDLVKFHNDLEEKNQAQSVPQTPDTIDEIKKMFGGDHE